MLIAFEIHDADLLLVPATDAARCHPAIMIPATGLFANLDKALLRLRLSNVAVVRDRDVSRRRRKRSECLHWHKKSPSQVAAWSSQTINPAPGRVVSYRPAD
jgi:hypothetical protein